MKPSQPVPGKERVAWISGAISGIGEATSRLFASQGVRVAVVGLRQNEASRVARDIVEQGGQAIGLEADVTDEGSVRQSIEAAAEHFGSLDILVNNAGTVDVRPLDQYSAEEWDRVMNVNLRSMFFAFKHALPHLRRRPKSWVVNVGSISSFVGQANTPVYTTSKHAVIGLTKSIALDYAAIGLRCNCVCPGITDTPMLRAHLRTTADPEETLNGRLARVPLRMVLSAMDVARSIAFLAGEDSNGITGASLIIDGGLLAAAEWTAEEGPPKDKTA